MLPSVCVKTLGDLKFDFEAVPTLRSYVLPTACTILCVPKALCGAGSTLHPLCSLLEVNQLQFRRGRNTRYGWTVNPFPTGSFTLQDAPSFAWRSNAYITGRAFSGPAPKGRSLMYLLHDDTPLFPSTALPASTQALAWQWHRHRWMEPRLPSPSPEGTSQGTNTNILNHTPDLMV